MVNFRQIPFILTTLLTVSCNHSGIVHDASVKLVSAEKVVSLDFDTTFHCVFSDVLNCCGVHIVNDTVLVVQDQVSENNPYHFKAYSTNTFNYLGAFIRNGRGPGEMFSPRIARDNTNVRYLSLKVNTLGRAYMVDVEKSIETGTVAIVQSYVLPSGIADWLPLSDSEQFTLQEEDREMIFHTINTNGTVCKTFNLYKGLDSERYVTHLSSILVNNGITGEVAEVMAFFPQINIIDTYSENVHSIAVNKDYCRWESVINRMLDMDSKEYYAGATSTSDYIFAAYKGLPLCRLNDPGAGTSIHVFDWADNFLYDIRVSENIDYMTFDSRTKFLYCVAKPENCIVRYDMSGLL